MGQPDATIRIQGQGSVPAVPDGIRFRLTLSATRKRPDEALQDVTARSERLDALPTELDIPDASHSTSGLSIREQRDGSPRPRRVPIANAPSIADSRRRTRSSFVSTTRRSPDDWSRVRSRRPMRSWTDRGGTWRLRTRAISRHAPKRLGTPVDERRRTRRRSGCGWERCGRSGTPSRPHGSNPGG